MSVSFCPALTDSVSFNPDAEDLLRTDTQEFTQTGLRTNFLYLSYQDSDEPNPTASRAGEKFKTSYALAQRLAKKETSLLSGSQQYEPRIITAEGFGAEAWRQAWPRFSMRQNASVILFGPTLGSGENYRHHIEAIKEPVFDGHDGKEAMQRLMNGAVDHIDIPLIKRKGAFRVTRAHIDDPHAYGLTREWVEAMRHHRIPQLLIFLPQEAPAHQVAACEKLIELLKPITGTAVLKFVDPADPDVSKKVKEAIVSVVEHEISNHSCLSFISRAVMGYVVRPTLNVIKSNRAGASLQRKLG